MTGWVLLSSHWRLQDVQAGLNVVINILCFTFIFVSAQFFWHKGATRLARREDVSLSSLMTFTNPGEVVDAARLLGEQLLTAQHVSLVVQGAVVVIFTLAATFAGPISRYSTRAAVGIGPRSVPGLLASRTLSCDVDNNVRWHDIFLRLEKSKFPLNQLLDYLPDTGTDWVFEPTEWNSTYLADCKFTPRTSLSVNLTGVHTNNAYWLYDEIPALWAILSPRFQRKDIIQNAFWGGIRDPQIGVWTDVIIWQYADMSSAEVSNAMNGSTQETTISIAALYLKNAPEYNMTTSKAGDFDWGFGIGEVGDAYYTKAECDIRRDRPEDNNFWEAYPQIRTQCDFASQSNNYWQAFAIQPADGNGENTLIDLPSGEDMFRFYQSWMIAKDTYYPWTSTRYTSVRINTVEISVAFIVVCALVIAVLLLGMFHWVLVRLRYRKLKVLRKIPGTKMDWVLQSVQESLLAAHPTALERTQITQAPSDRRDLWLGARYAPLVEEISNTPLMGKIQMLGLSESSPNNADSPSEKGRESHDAISTMLSPRVGKSGALVTQAAE